MSLLFAFAIAAAAGPTVAPHHSAHFRHYRHFRSQGAGPAAAAPPATGADGESFVKDGRRYYWLLRGGRRYYWLLRGGRRVYSSHPPAGYQPAGGPALGPPAVTGGVADLDAPLSPAEQTALAARQRQAQARLVSLEHRIGHLRHLERLRAHPPRPVKRHP